MRLNLPVAKRESQPHCRFRHAEGFLERVTHRFGHGYPVILRKGRLTKTKSGLWRTGSSLLVRLASLRVAQLSQNVGLTSPCASAKLNHTTQEWFLAALTRRPDFFGRPAIPHKAGSR